MIEQPGCPNLYWALTYLPDPVISIRKGLQGERMMFTNELGGLDEFTRDVAIVRTTPRSPR